MTDGPPALALGVDPADDGLMERPPRPVGERVITPAMWRGIVFVGVIMAAGTLFVLDASLPGGFVDGSGDLRYAQTMAFTTLMLFQIFNVFNARSDDRSAFAHLFTNRWLWAAVAGSVVLQVVVVYVPFLQNAFGTTPLSAPGLAVLCRRRELRVVAAGSEQGAVSPGPQVISASRRSRRAFRERDAAPIQVARQGGLRTAVSLAFEQRFECRVRVNRRRVVLHQPAGIRGRPVVAVQLAAEHPQQGHLLSSMMRGVRQPPRHDVIILVGHRDPLSATHRHGS